MLIISDSFDLKKELKKISHRDLRIALIPTMGALHEGHMQLIRKAKQHAQYVVVSLFVNPLQFNKEEDFINYHSDLAGDLQKLSTAETDLVFNPTAQLLFPNQPAIKFNLGTIAKNLEGAHRPGHFEGVALVVTKLFNLVNPHVTFFGLKDLQQFMVVKAIIKELSFDINLHGIPTVREQSGLAMSSRNLRLSVQGKHLAAIIYQGLSDMSSVDLMKATPPILKADLMSFYSRFKGLTIEYCEIIDIETFNILTSFEEHKNIAICVAAYVEGIRLIYNIYLRQEVDKK